MAIITLTTDFGEKDHFAGAIKGAIYSELPEVRIVDVSHSVSNRLFDMATGEIINMVVLHIDDLLLSADEESLKQLV